MNERQQRKPVIYGIEETRKKEEEVQNTLTLKSEGEKVSTFKNMNCKLISKI